MFFKDRFFSSLKKVGARTDSGLYKELETRYQEEHRYYHDTSHIVECLNHLDSHHSLAEKHAEVEIAIWFHDAVYDVHQADNEEQSAALATQWLTRLQAPADVIQRVSRMILATKTHVARTPDEGLLLDIDLGILGASPDAFERYDAAIRKEYSWIPLAQYRAGRAAILNAFLARPRLYTTGRFYDLFEQNARRNMAGKIEQLTSGE